MKKETQFLCLVLICGLTLITSGCGIMPSKVMSPSEVEQEKQDQLNGTSTDKSKNSVGSDFPAIYPKAVR